MKIRNDNLKKTRIVADVPSGEFFEYKGQLGLRLTCLHTAFPGCSADLEERNTILVATADGVIFKLEHDTPVLLLNSELVLGQ